MPAPPRTGSAGSDPFALSGERWLSVPTAISGVPHGPGGGPTAARASRSVHSIDGGSSLGDSSSRQNWFRGDKKYAGGSAGSGSGAALHDSRQNFFNTTQMSLQGGLPSPLGGADQHTQSSLLGGGLYHGGGGQWGTRPRKATSPRLPKNLFKHLVAKAGGDVEKMKITSSSVEDASLEVGR